MVATRAASNATLGDDAASKLKRTHGARKSKQPVPTPTRMRHTIHVLITPHEPFTVASEDSAGRTASLKDPTPSVACAGGVEDTRDGATLEVMPNETSRHAALCLLH